jgi:hypothetical protein
MQFTGTNALLGITSLVGADMVSASVAGSVGPVNTPATIFTQRAHTFTGLPVTGFMVTARTNSSVACTLPGGAAGTCSGNYAALFGHSYRTIITP